MKSDDVKRTIDRALKKAKLVTKQRPKLLSDNGSCYIAIDLKDYLKENIGMDQVHGRPGHLQTQGKIERYHKNVVQLDYYHAPEELEKALEKFVHYYNNERYHESLNNLTPADVYFGRGEAILQERERIKKKTLLERRKAYQRSILWQSFENKIKKNSFESTRNSN